MIHAANSVRITFDAGNFDALLFARLLRMALLQTNRLLILLLQAETEIRNFTQKLHVQIESKPRSPRSETII
jgi:hypothetical protein